MLIIARAQEEGGGNEEFRLSVRRRVVERISRRCVLLRRASSKEVVVGRALCAQICQLGAHAGYYDRRRRRTTNERTNAEVGLVRRNVEQEAPLRQRDRATRCQFKSCQLLRIVTILNLYALYKKLLCMYVCM